MADSQQIIRNDIEILSQSLLSTLDEASFFALLCDFLHKEIAADKTLLYMVTGETTVKLISINGELVASEPGEMTKGEGPIGHIIRTKSAYFSNNVVRDPLFIKEAKEGVISELCIPIIVENIVLGTIHFKVLKEGRPFSKQDIDAVTDILKEFKKPLANMKMYLTAKNLNDTLLKQIKVKEKELEERRVGVPMVNDFRIKEREIIVESESMKRLLDLADRVAATDVHALITGERGVGKEMIARRIHCRSKRSINAFISIDCGSFDEKQLEKELFGEESSDFNHGDQMKMGMLEKANGGTLFLNNISSLSPQIQSKLAYFINEKMTYRIGGQVPYRVDVRVIGALVSSIDKDIFMTGLTEDLYYCLNTMELIAPPLRDRKEDIETLSTHFLNKRRTKEAQKSLSPCVVTALKNYHWPGNVKELQNIVERAYILSDSMIIEKTHLPDYVFLAKEEDSKKTKQSMSFTEMTLDELERRHILQALDHLGGNKTKTARSLGITVKTLYNKLHSYGLISATKEA